MMYQLYQAHADLLLPLRGFARFGASMMRFAECCSCSPLAMRQVSAALTMFADTGLTHDRPSFDLDRVRVGQHEVAVTEEATDDTPFGTLLHFRKDTNVV